MINYWLGIFCGIVLLLLSQFTARKDEVPIISSEGFGIVVNSETSDITLSQYGPRMMYIRDTNACYMATVIAVNCIDKEEE